MPPRVVADLEKSALMHIAKLMISLVKGPKRMITKVQKNDWHENVWELVINYVKGHDRSGRPENKRDTSHELEQGPGWTSIIECTTIWLCLSRHEAAEVYSQTCSNQSNV